MKDRVPANPNRRLITPEDGSPPFYATVERADNPIQEGTLLDKASLLPDSVESAIWGSAADRTPAQALQQLRSLINTAQNTANSAYSKISIATGSYQGILEPSDSSETKTLTLSIYPKLVIVKLRGVLASFGTGIGGNWNISAMAIAVGSDVTILLEYRDSNSVNREHMTGNNGTLTGRTLTLNSKYLNAAGATYDYFAIG